MAHAAAERLVITTVDGVPLKTRLRQVSRANRIRAFLLVMPLLAFLTVTFLLPIVDMLQRSVYDPELRDLLPRTSAALAGWDGRELPGEDVFRTMVEELGERREDRTIGSVAQRLNYEAPGMRSLITGSARKLSRQDATITSYRETLIDADPKWGENATWGIIKRAGETISVGFYLAAVDRFRDGSGEVIAQPENERIYVPLFIRTLWVSLLITVLTLILGYPIAYLMATMPTRISNLLMILVLLPFWTSLLVRTTSWIVLLQTNGVLNDLMVWLRIIDDSQRLSMIYNMNGTIVAMTHILLPFMVLPLFSVMKTISPSYVRAAQSLGATPARSFWRVYFPQSVPGIGAGSLLVFILAIGYYITPALVGGRTGQLISNFIAYHMNTSLNWGLAAALGAILLGGVLALYWLYNRLVGIDNMRMG